MIEEIEQILADSFTYNLPANELHQAAVDIDELVRARTLPVYLRLCTVEWSLRLAMNNLADLREEPVAQGNLKEKEKK